MAKLRGSRYLDFPAHVHLETFARCNAHCSFCPSDKLERRGTRMSSELIEKIVGDLAAIPGELPFQLSPFKVNEPFLDTRLFDILELINRRLPNAEITLTTNGSPLTDEKLARLIRVRNIGYLWISLNERSPEEYERVMGIRFASTIARLAKLHRAKCEGQLPFIVVLSRVGDGSIEDARFVRWAKVTFPLFEVSIFRRGSWLGQVDSAVGLVPDVGCMRWFDLSITATGAVAHCCMDGMARHVIGNVATTHALEIYNSRPYRTLREQVASRRTVAPCNTCSFL
ncbi:MAG TPA: radical SAM protein [Candidatus Binataceae bacterium]|nr:radical SAM protein [Candidatus Binataceae bacterium]